MSAWYNNGMNFDEYQREIEKFDAFEQSSDPVDPAFVVKILGLSGEAGEVTEKFKKVLRDGNGKLTEDSKREIVKEMGDVLWYLATISRYMGVPFSEVAEGNIEKLSGRLERGTIHGKGDNR